MESDFNQEGIARSLTTRWLGRHFRFFATIDSSNRRLLEMAAADPALPQGAMLVADYQSAGRGRLGRRWEVPAGTALLFSLFLRLDWPAERGHWLTMMAGVAAVEALAAVCAVDAALKWPNDVVVGQASAAGWRKLGGILPEGVWVGGRLDRAVLGVGLNVNVAAEEMPAFPLPATSVLQETGHACSRLALLPDLLARLEAYFEAAQAGQSPQAAWLARLSGMGRAVRVTGSGRPSLDGVAEGTDAWGNLLLRDDAGRLHVIAAGEVSLRPGGPPAPTPGGRGIVV